MQGMQGWGSQDERDAGWAGAAQHTQLPNENAHSRCRSALGTAGVQRAASATHCRRCACEDAGHSPLGGCGTGRGGCVRQAWNECARGGQHRL